MRLLNDPSLDRRKREFHMRQLQGILLEHQAKQEAKAAKLVAKTAKREQVSRSNRNQGVADQSQVLAWRREFERGIEAAAIAVASSPVLRAVQQAGAASNEIQLTGRSRPVLTLKRV
jgi:hypothetical protein